MTAEFVNYMEMYSYTVAKRDYCIADRESKRIAMPELFDMIAGSETGAIIGTIINLPNNDTTSTQPNRYFAKDVTDWFENNNPFLYHNPKMSFGMKLFISILFFGFMGPLIYCCLRRCYEVKDFEKYHDDLSYIIKKEQVWASMDKAKAKHQRDNDGDSEHRGYNTRN